MDIRVCIEYRLVNDLTQLMVYPTSLINELLEDLYKALWYCSLDMANSFWVFGITKRAIQISTFITPLGLFEWIRMPFGLQDAPQIYHRLLDNALYGVLGIPSGAETDGSKYLCKVGYLDERSSSSILGQRSYMDDILIPAKSWHALCPKLERLLDVYDYWNLSISAVKSS